jgi:hypothetical protein
MKPSALMAMDTMMFRGKLPLPQKCRAHCSRCAGGGAMASSEGYQPTR